MSDAVISAQGLSKRYRIGNRQRATTLREGIIELARAPLRLGRRSAPETIWALKDVSFEVAPGEVVGIIGRNGAGKSTLLKILARITEPTEGRAEVRGRVGSLLEVGTGFHSELTGRENIFLNGAILGMKRAEILAKFDEIVAFAEVEKFIDTPVKHYSSGMYLRLAFAVAAHLEHEILLVDEVLAVGDASFQKKCLGKMNEVSKGGRTVLFVSHNMAAVQGLCSRAVLIHGGRVAAIGPTNEIVTRYIRECLNPARFGNSFITRNEKSGVVFKRFDLMGTDGQVLPSAQTGALVLMRLTVETPRPYNNVQAAIGVNTDCEDIRVCIFESWLVGAELTLEPPESHIYCAIPRMPLYPGNYRLNIQVMAGTEVLFYVPGAVDITVTDGDYYGTGNLPNRQWSGFILAEQAWHAKPAGCQFSIADLLVRGKATK
jgi:lipopolysaccharide transport system ATP-binding protein